MSLPTWLTGINLRSLLGSKRPDRRLSETTLVVIDVDVTGTDSRRDQLIGVALLPIQSGSFRIGDLRYCAVATTGTDAAAPPAPRTLDWQRDYLALRAVVADHPLVTINPRFVRQMIARHARQAGMPIIDSDWVDLAAAANVVADPAVEVTSLRHWLTVMSTGGERPHDARFDVFAMAQLLLAVITYCEDAGMHTVEALARGVGARKWLPDE
ncbi:MAG: hypothetical protein ABIS17_08030 [Casimicrobiaceae bacterium]